MTGTWTSRRGAVVAAWILVFLAIAGSARAASPQLDGILPRGAPRGSETTFVLTGARLSDAADLILDEAQGPDAVTLVKLEVADDRQVRATLRIPERCRLGEHSLRVRTRTGVSELRTYHVGALSGVDEVEPNGDLAVPQKIPLNATVSGVVAAEDVDYYAFEAKKGQRVTAEVEAMRLAGGVFDAHVAILDAGRFELAACDDASLLRQDPVASVVIPADGTYVVAVRECAYGGNDGCRYRMHVGTFARPLAVLPSGGRPGEELEVTFLGDVGGEIRSKVSVPRDPPPGFGLFAEDAGGPSPSPIPFRVTDLANVLETEPNDGIEQATVAPASSALGGVISRVGDVDHFRLPCKKGQVLDIQVHARRLRSALDPVLVVLDPSGAGVASNDDAVGPDSALRFTAPEDKEYVIRIADHLGKGGPCHVYRVEVTSVVPRIELGIPKVAQFSQERQTFVVARGNRYATLVSANRLDFGGDLSLAFEGLPQGVTVVAEPFTGGATAVPVLFEAAADAPVAGGFLQVLARPTDPAQTVVSTWRQDVELVVGGPGQSVYWSHEASRPVIAVAEELPFRIHIVEPKAPIVRGGSMGLRVVAERNEGFKAPIRLQLPFVPPGISAAGNVTIPEGQSEAAISINAGGGAPLRPWRIVAVGASDAGGGAIWAASQFATLTVADPFFTLRLDRGSVEQGKETEVLCNVDQQSPFEGVARVELVGLPPKVGSAPLEVTKETTQLVFKVTADRESPPGQHKGVFCRVAISVSGEEVVYGTGGSELRIDVPPPPKADQPAPPPQEVAAPAPEAPKQPAEKPLTRLEKLRLEAQKGSGPERKE